jgi:hypothetical protein
MAVNPLAWFDAIASIRRLADLEKKHAALIAKQADEIQALKDRVTALEAREGILVAEAKSAAGAAASLVAGQHVAGLAQSIGRLEGRLDGLTPRLPPPA